MNILFALYGDLISNSAFPLMLHARELQRAGHQCAVAVPVGLDTAPGQDSPPSRGVLFEEALAHPAALFPDARPADIVHAWTPRECVRKFVTAYLAIHPAPLVVYNEDNEDWISRQALGMVGLREDVLLQHSEDVISQWTAEGLSHVLHYRSFIGLADAAVVIQDKLAPEVPPWVPVTTVMPGVDLDFFSPRPASSELRKRYGLKEGERVIVYNGGLNDFTRPGLETLCRVVGLVAEKGVPCRLLRTGPVPLDFLDRLPSGIAERVTELGILPREALPDLLALADVLVQPGKHDPFEDLRLPGKLPEFFAMGRPVLLPDTNIAGLLQDGIDAIIHRSGTPEEIADRCLELFADPARARAIGEAGRRFAETHFDPKTQAAKLLEVYEAARDRFDPALAAKLWTDDAERISPSALLVRKLRLLAEAGGTNAASSAMLEALANSMEFTLERAAGLETGMAVRDREIAARNETIAARDQEIAARDQEIAALNGEIAGLRGEIAALNGEVATLNGEIATRDGHIATFAKCVEDRNARIDALEKVVAELGTHIDLLRRTIAGRDHHIATLESTLSWRITSPLRSIGRLLRRRGHGDR
jgi:glycosyltransferase involved in cell wall biosynthesis